MRIINEAEFVSKVQPALARQDWDLLHQIIRTNWTADQLLHLLRHGGCDARKVAALAIGMVGGNCALTLLAKLLQDQDPIVVEMAEHAMWQIWFRGGCADANRLVARGAEALNMQDVDRAMEHLNRAIAMAPDFPEAYNQRAIAFYLSEQHHESIADSKRTIELMPLHFGAWAGMGHCFLASGMLAEALDAYENALRINPHLQCVAELAQEIRERTKG
ncbi:MAG: tetratricopeptide repeat protein [Burkholderiales bacterium]|nr:tetratricopeptide repeat protein [Phycisphaerae bacterium]